MANANNNKIAVANTAVAQGFSTTMKKVKTTIVAIALAIGSFFTIPTAYALGPLPPVIKTFTAAPATIIVGQSTKLSWTLAGVSPATLSINNGVGSVRGTFSKIVAPKVTTTYVLRAGNTYGIVAKSVKVIVKPKAPVISTFIATPTAITAGQSTKLSWTLAGGSPATLSINNGVGSVRGTFSKIVAPKVTTNYVLRAGNTYGIVAKSVKVIVKPKAPVISTFTAAPTAITAGQSTKLSWTLAGGSPATLSINNGVGSVRGTFSKIVAPKLTTNYVLRA